MPTGISSRPTIRVSASSVISEAITKSVGSTSSTLVVRAFSSICLAGSTQSASTIELPTSSPLATRKVNAMPPPMSTVSQTLDELVDHAELVAHLAPAKDGHERAVRVGEHARERLDFTREQHARVRRQERRNARRGRVRPVSSAERVVHKDVAKRGELARELRDRWPSRPDRTARSRA